MQMHSVKIVLDTRSKKKDGTYPIKLRIVIDRQTYHISLGKSLPLQDWNENSGNVKTRATSVKNVSRLNHFLTHKKQEAEDVLLSLETKGVLRSTPFPTIRSQIVKGRSEVFVLEYFDEAIELMKVAGRRGNARVYRNTRGVVSNFLAEKDIPLPRISYQWLKQFEAWHLGKGNSINSLSVYLRTIRALLNRAIKEGKLSKELYAFEHYTIKQEETRKRAMTLEEFQAFRSFEPQTERQARAKRYFLISFYMMGASFVDLAYLKVSNIHQGRIEYKRKKTGKLHSIPITSALDSLLFPEDMRREKYEYILPIIKPERTSASADRQIREELKRVNKTLKEIGQLAQIKTPLTSYVSRHTYATLAKLKGVPTAVISEALGHKSEEITQVYLSTFDRETMDHFHEIVVK